MKWLLSLGFVFLSLLVSSQCEVDAGEDVTICQGESVVIGGSPTVVQSNGNPNISWSNGAGNSDNPTVSPNSTTTYTVTLTGNGCNETSSITVTVLPSPNANFTFGPNNACAGVPVTFTNTSSNCPSCTYSWNFDNPSSGSNTSSANNPTHVFEAVGNGNQVFDVTLTITAANGCTDTQTTAVTVQQAPNAVLTEDANFIQCLGVPAFDAFVTDASTPANNASYTIIWGDGTPNYSSSSAPNFEMHTYNGLDIFDLTYTVEGNNGCQTTETYVVTNISNPAVGAANPGNTLQCGPVEFCFPLSNYQNNHPSTIYILNYGDGSPTQTINHPPPTEICHEYSTSSCGSVPAFYTFSIEAENNCPNTSLATISPIQIGTPPIASFSPDQNPGCVNVPITFINNSLPGYNLNCSGNVAYTWDFGDGSAPLGPQINGGSVSHTYTATGTYTVTLTAGNAGSVASSCGQTTFEFDVCIESAPTPIFTLGPTVGCLPLTSSVDNTSNNGISCNLFRSWVVDYIPDTCTPTGGSYSYQGGTNAGSDEPIFQFTSQGTYIVTLEMQNACGLFTDVETVTVNTVPEVDVLPFAAICAGQSINPSAIIDNCNAPILSYAWSMTGGSPASSAAASPGPVTYANPGNNFSISLTASNACGPTTSTETLVVQAPPVINISPVDPVICAGQQLTITATGANTYSWQAGTGIVSTSGGSATVAPNTSTTYTVNGTSSAGCPASQTIDIDVNPLPIVAPLDIYSICQGDCITLGLNISGGSAPYVSYSWSPATGLDDPSSPTPTACPNNSITYTATVTDVNGCVGTITVPVTVFLPTAVNAGPDITVCNQPVGEQLTGFSPAGGVWSGPNVTGTGLFTPSGTGTFTLTYTYTNANGCISSDQRIVTVIDPQLADAGPDVEICALSPAFNLVPVTPGGTWSGTGVAANGVYTPSTAGTFTLTYTLGGGSCLSTDQIEVTVWELPVPNAGLDTPICAGDSIQLNGSSTGGLLPYTSTIWNNAVSLSDAAILNPWASPVSSTSYTLTVTDANSCVAQDVVQIQVLAAPIVAAGPDITVCDQPIAEVLTGYSPLTGATGTGEWTGPNVSTNGTFTPNGAGVFTLYYTFTNLAGCFNVDSIQVTVASPVNANAGPDLDVCLNTPAFNLAAGGTWSGTNVSTAGVFTPASTGTFTLTFTTGTGTCQTSDNTDVTVLELPTVNAGVDVFICEEDSIQLVAVANSTNVGAILYNWTGPAVSDNQIADPFVQPAATQSYTITVTDGAGCISSDAVIVNVNGLPVVNAGADITVCDQPIAEVLSGFSPLPVGVEMGEWTGTGVTNPNGEFTSPGIGTYTLYYTFSDIAGCVNLDSIEVTVVAPVIADAGLPQSMCLNNGPYTLVNFVPASGGDWSGVGVSEPIGTFDPLIAGVGTFTLTLENGSGTCYTSDDVEVTVLPLPVINVSADPVYCGNDGIQPLGAFSPTGGTWEGTGINDAALGLFDPSIGTGTYPVFYWYTDPATGCADTSNVSVSVSPVPVADFTLAPQGCTNAAADIQNLSTGAQSYLWYWGNGDTNVGFEPSYTYNAEGFFDVSLVATNAFGCADSTSHQNEIINPPTAELTLLPAEGCAPLVVDFDNTSTGQYLSFNWDLDIATSNDSIPPSQTYQQGNDVVFYDISLTVTNYCGSETATDIVTVNPQPIAGFGTDYDEFCTPWPAEINNISVGNPDTYLWDFGDGSTSTLAEPMVHTFYTDTVPTQYTITLIATNECGVDTASYTITVLPNTVTAFFNTNVTEGCQPLVVEFTDFSDGGTVVAYDFGDDAISNNPNPIHTFTEPGDYIIYQFVNNGCSFDTTTAMVTVFPSPMLDFTTAEPSVCANTGVQFINLSTDVNNVIWDFGDGNTTDETNPIHTYPDGGVYTVTLSGTSMFNECEATIQQPFSVTASPVANISVASQVGCSPFTVNFSNTTTGGLFYNWNFGDGETGNGQNVSHTFLNDTGNPLGYTVVMVAENIQLCSDSMIIDIVVSPTPIADFTLSEVESCYAPFEITTQNNSVFANGYEWSFNPFGTSQLFEPTITVDAVGTWNVTMIASNAYGCEDAMTQQVTINPLPVANFTSSQPFGCIDLPVSFTNLSTGAATYEWDFGDGDLSVTNNPSHIYDEDGYYTVSLVATTAAGCTDTLTYDNMIAAYPLPIANFTYSPDVANIYNANIAFQDQSVNPFAWNWNFGDGTYSSDQNPDHTYAEAGTYGIQLTVNNIYGCEDRDEGVVTIIDQFNIYVPNAFTPDNDNINDIFKPVIVGRDLIDFYEFRIFDRWGVLVFETQDMDAFWMGDFRQGGDYYVQSDVYVWQVKIRLKDAEKSELIEGHVTQVR